MEEPVVSKPPENSPLFDVEQPVVVAEPVEPAEPGQEPIIPAEQVVQADKPFEPTLKSAWERLEKDGITIPDDIKQGKFKEGKDEWQTMVDIILENTESEPDGTEGDPFIENYRKVPADQKENYITEYNNAKAFFNLSPQDGLKAWYQSQTVEKEGKQERRWDDATIDKSIEQMNPIQQEQEWDKAKGVAKKQFDDMYTRGSSDMEKVQAQRIEAINKVHLQKAEALSAEIDTMKEFAGIPLNEDIKKTAKRNLELLTQINPKTGKPHLLGYLDDNKKLRNLVLADTLLNGDAIQEYLSSQKENYAETVLSKLDVVPKPKSGTVGAPSGGHKPEP